MHTNDSFLLAIEAEPADRVRRLVYADWLDDRHDPRAELVRVEEEMRALPVFADRFWELKPRRNELRVIAGGDWCARMRYGTECEPVFRHGIPDGWRDRWRLIREFTERWHRIPMPDVGGRANEIAQAETQVGHTFPPSLREWVAFAHDLNARQQNPAEELRVPFGDSPELVNFSNWQENGSNRRLMSILIDDQRSGAYRAIEVPDLNTADPFLHEYYPSNAAPGLDYYEFGYEAVISELGLDSIMDSVGARRSRRLGIRDPEGVRRELRRLGFSSFEFLHSRVIWERDNCYVLETTSAPLGTNFFLTATGTFVENECPAALWPGEAD